MRIEEDAEEPIAPEARGGLERWARVALVVGVAWGLLACLLWGSTGGFVGHVGGLRFQVQSLRNPMTLSLLLVALWAALSRDGARRALAWLGGLDETHHRLLPWFVCGAATGVMGVIKGWQHYSFQTCAYDLGIYANVIWNTAHGDRFYSGIEHQNYLGDHFSLYFVFLAPFTHVVDASVLMLAIQCLGIGLGGVAVYRLVRRLAPPRAAWAPLALTLAYFANPYLGEVSRFDAHPIALAIPLFLWMMLCIEEERNLGVFLLAMIAVLIEETLLPPLVVSGVYLAARHRRTRSIGLLLAVGAAAFFVLELRWWMPLAIDRTDIAHATRYANLGDTLPEVMGNVLRNPFLLLRELVHPPEKIRTCLSLLASVAFLPLLAPRQALLAAVPLASVIVSCSDHQYRLTDQYSATTLPFLFYASAWGLASLLHERPALDPVRRPRVLVPVGLLLLASLIRQVPDYMGDWYPDRVQAVRAMIAAIPEGDSVCAMQPFAPHLVNRRQLTMFGDALATDWCIRDADWLLLDSNPRSATDAYPLGHDGTRAAVAELRASGRYRVVEEAHGVLLMRRAVAGPPKSSPATY